MSGPSAEKAEQQQFRESLTPEQRASYDQEMARINSPEYLNGTDAADSGAITYGTASDDAVRLDPIEVTGQRVAPMSGFDLLDQRMWNTINALSRSYSNDAARRADIAHRQDVMDARRINFANLQSQRRYDEYWKAVEMQAIGADPAIDRLKTADFANPANWGKPDWDQRYAAAAQPLYDLWTGMAVTALLPVAGGPLMSAGRAAVAFGRGLGSEAAGLAHAARTFGPFQALQLAAGGAAPRLAVVGGLSLGTIEGAPFEGPFDAAAAGVRAAVRAPGTRDVYDFAVGLANHESTRAAGLLDRFAKHVDADTYFDRYKTWASNGPDDLATKIRDAMDGATKIHVNLDGVASSASELPAIEWLGKQGIDYRFDLPDGRWAGNITNWEVSTIMNNSDLRSKTVFYLNGEPITVP